MKEKTQPKSIESGDYLQQSLFAGLTRNQAAYAQDRLKWFESMGLAPPYGIIRKKALEQ